MSNLLTIALIARAQQNRRNREARARRAREDDRRRARLREEEARKRSYTRDTTGKRYSSKEYLYKLVSEDESLVKFFDLVDERATQIEADDKQKDLLEIQGLLQDSLDKMGKVRDVQDRLTEAGVTLSPESTIYGGAVGVKTTPGYGFGGIGDYGYNSVNFPVQFNGVVVTRDHLNNPDVNPYENDYMTCRAANEDLAAKQAEIEKAISRKELFLKVSPFARAKTEAELKGLRMELEDVKGSIEVGRVKKAKMDAYAALTPEQKGLIKEYYDAIDEYKVTGENVSNRINENIQMGKRYGKFKDVTQSRWEMAVSQLLAEGVITEDDVKSVEDKLVSFEIEEDRYDEGISEYTLSNGRRDYSGLVTYFYNKPKIEQKRKEVAEKKEKMDKLRAEEKVISETEELAQKVANDKTRKPEDEQK